ncbi:MAG: glycoside hydrolase family 3 C-terminal domain-containing protein [Muribaculaceae bacterium]|nr:glycoside hydrolase family 3 C-terminal domain-containing protein [Muribaculaceae bacterium]
MKRLLLSIFTFTIAFCAMAEQPLYKNPNASVDERVEDLISRMTLHEKIMQMKDLSITDFLRDTNMSGGVSFGSSHEMGKDAYESACIHAALDKYMADSTRLGIPVITSVEGIQGIIQDGCTLFPHALAQSTTFNPDLIRRMTDAAGREADAIGIHEILSPVLDIARELRWGRIEETFGEDPYLIGEMAVAFIDGYQKNHPIYCMPKHFVAHGSPSGGLNSAHVAGGPRELWSIYLPPFRKVIDRCKPSAIMSCYSAYDGVAISGSYYYLTELLRNQLGFDGYVYSDWGAIDRLHTQHFNMPSQQAAAIKAVKAGLDLGVYGAFLTLEDAVQKGLVEEAVIDNAVRRILRAKFRLGLFEDKPIDPERVWESVHTPEHIAIAKEVADESLILMENNGILPLDLKKYKKIAVVGPNADFAVMGDYSWVRADQKVGVTLLQGLLSAIEASPNANGIEVAYAEGCDWWSNDTTAIDEAVQLAADSDVAIVAVGTRSTWWGRGPNKSTSGESFDLSSLDLPGSQQLLLEKVKATGKPLVVVLISGRPFAMPWVKENADAFVVQWYSGEQQGAALADALLGNVNPSGKLSVSFPRSTGNIPCYYNHYATDREGWDKNGSADDPGLRYIFEPPTPLWRFGHGLSYTTFSYGDMTTDKTEYSVDDNVIRITVPVTNTGSRVGKEVVQLYVRDVYSSVDTPVMQLKGFDKIELQPGETRIVEIELPISELALFDEAMREVVEPGDFELMIGSASDDIRCRKTIPLK